MATLSLPLPLPLPLPPWRAHGHAPWQKGPRSCAMHRTVPCLGASYRGIQPLYDDGYQTWRDLDEYYTALGELAEHDSGAPCWFCPAGAGPPVAGAPAMLYLPGAEGMGLGLLMHHKALGSIFELRCMHIPFRDRTPFEGLVAFVEDELRSEHGNSPHKPIYLLGNSFGGCLALAVAARNPNMDLVLVLVNPATSFEQSDIQHLLSVFRFLSDRASITITNLLNYNIDNEVNMVMSSMKSGTPPLEALNMLSNNLSSFLKHSDMLDMVPSDTLMWKVRLLKSASSYANRRLQAVTAEVLLLIRCFGSTVQKQCLHRCHVLVTVGESSGCTRGIQRTELLAPGKIRQKMLGTPPLRCFCVFLTGGTRLSVLRGGRRRMDVAKTAHSARLWVECTRFPV